MRRLASDFTFNCQRLPLKYFTFSYVKLQNNSSDDHCSRNNCAHLSFWKPF